MLDSTNRYRYIGAVPYYGNYMVRIYDMKLARYYMLTEARLRQYTDPVLKEFFLQIVGEIYQYKKRPAEVSKDLKEKEDAFFDFLDEEDDSPESTINNVIPFRRPE